MEEIERGYAIFYTDYGVRVVQKIDDLDAFGVGKFETDTEAGEQALKDGYNVYKASDDDEALAGWYILKEQEG